jgi:hypothetical protein
MMVQLERRFWQAVRLVLLGLGLSACDTILALDEYRIATSEDAGATGAANDDMSKPGDGGSLVSDASCGADCAEQAGETGTCRASTCAGTDAERRCSDGQYVLSPCPLGSSCEVDRCRAQEWVAQFGTAGFDEVGGVAEDANGSVLVAGYADALPGQVSAGGSDAFVRKYGTDGTELRTWQFGSSSFDRADAVALDGTGSMFVVGTTNGALPSQVSASGEDVFVRKYAPDGAESWTRQFGSDEDDAATAVHVDPSGSVVVAGYTDGELPGQASAGGGNEAFVRKYDADGTELWTRQFGSTAFARAEAVSGDAFGSVFVAGIIGGSLSGQISAGGDADAFIRKYAADGAELWTRQFGTSGGDLAMAVSADSNGNVFVAGYAAAALQGQPFAGGRDAFVRKYDTNGTELWTRQFGALGEDIGTALSVAANGSVVVTGVTAASLPGQVSAGSDDAFVRKYAADGAELWTRQLGSTGDDSGDAVSVDAFGSVFVAGNTDTALPGQASAGQADGFVLKIVE